MRYDPSSYEGAAVRYRRGRPPYLPGLEALLVAELGLDGAGRLLDVGCGPGFLAVRLAPLFAGAVGLEPDPAMIAEGRQAVQERDIANITWIQGRAEELPAVAPGPYRLVTFGHERARAPRPHLFGNRIEAFADEVRALLRERSLEGLFWDWPGDTEVMRARKPQSSSTIMCSPPQLPGRR